MNEAPTLYTIGLVSDTHGLLRLELLTLFAGCRTIVHAGDVGKPEILAKLQTIAPVVAVRGNNDRGDWAESLPEKATLTPAGARICVIHDLAELDFDPASEGYQAVVSGHSHRPRLFHNGDVLYINPGSAGPRRFKLPISVGFLEIAGGQVTGRLRQIAI